jgi:glutamate/tyrosine decarboxylase-like PLP-dependent enzyme
LAELEVAARALEPDAGERRRLREAFVDVAERYAVGLPDQAGYVEPGSAGVELPTIGRAGCELGELVAILEQQILEPGGHPAAAGHLAYLSGGGLYHTALADFLAAATNKYAGIAYTGPGPVAVENQVVRWVADLVGYPPEAGGAILSGGSLANLTALAAARAAHGIRSADVPRLVVYLTEQTHHAVRKALAILGLAEAGVRTIALDARGRMSAEELARRIERDREAGLRPWLVVANAGTTDTGAVDPLEAIGAIAHREGCWFHVDAAYGGFFLLTELGREVLRGIETSDSVVLDPHKSLFLPWGSGVAVVREVRHLRASFDDSGHYLQDSRDVSETSPAEVSPELTKPFRALGIWLPLMLLGTAPFAAALEEKMLLARFFWTQVRALGFEVGPEPDLSVVTFRWRPPVSSPEAEDAANQRLLEAIRRDGRIFLSSTQLDGRFTLRMAALAHRTHRETIDLALVVLEEISRRLAADLAT